MAVTTDILLQQPIQHRIYTIRGMQVMLDRDLAVLYGVETKVLNQAVKRNIERFPAHFMFQLTTTEYAVLKSQIVTANIQVDETKPITATKSNRGGSRTIPYVFTEQGVAMLSAVLRSQTAISVSIAIMDAFVQARNLIISGQLQHIEMAELRARIQKLEESLEGNLEAVNDLSEDMRKELDNIYDAIGALSVKPANVSKPRKPIGFDI